MDTISFNKTPTTLATLAAKKVDDNALLFFCPIDVMRWCRRTVKEELYIVENVFSCNLFDFKLYNGFQRLPGDENCSEAQNTIGAMLLAEFEPIWFKLLHKVVINPNTIGKQIWKIPISIHFYKQLFEQGIIYKLLQTQTLADISQLLLQLSGDVELNPGPVDYKDVCKNAHYKKRQSRKIYKSKEELKAERVIKRAQDESFVFERKPHKQVEVEMQVLGLASMTAQFVGNSWLGFKTNQTMNKVQQHAEILTSELQKTLSAFRETFSEMKQFIYKGLNVIDLVGDVMMALLQISFAKPGYKLASLSVELFRLLTKHNITTAIVDGLRTFVYPYFNKKEVEMQVDNDEVQDPSFIEGLNPTHIVVFLISILSAVFLCALPKQTQMEATLKRVGDVCRSGKSIVDFNSVTHNSIGVALEDFKVNYLGMRPKNEIEDFISGIDRWFDEVRSLLTRADEWKKSDQILRDPKVVIEVENLYKRGLEFSREISDKKMQRDMTLPFNQHMRLLSDLMKMVDTSGAFGTRPRTQPVVIWLFGESGVGKSGMSWPLAVDLNNLFVHNEQEAKEFSKNIYMRNVEQEFWDNYQGQNVVIYDDFGQRVDSTGNPNEEFMELIRTANIAPYPLHMAHLEDKRKTRFTSKVLLLTSNVFEQSVNSLTFPDAFRRRIDLCARVTNKDEFTKAGHSAAKGCAVQRLDKEKVRKETGEIISTDVYQLELVDPESGVSIEAGLSYEEFLERAIEKAHDAFDSSSKMNDFLERYAASRFKKQNKEDSRAKNVEMQIDIPKSYVYCYDFLNDKTIEQIEELAENYSLVDQENKLVFNTDLELVKCEFFDLEDPKPEYDQWLLGLYRERYLERSTLLGKRLLAAKDMAMKSCTSWADSIAELTKDHPYMVASAIIGTVSTLFMVSKFWQAFYTTPKPVIKVTEYKVGANVVKLHQGEEAIDISNVPLSKMRDILPNMLLAGGFSTAGAILARKPNPLALGLIGSLVEGATIYVKDRFFTDHGTRIMLCPRTTSKLQPVVEAVSSADPVTLKAPRIKVEALSSADPVTLKAPRLKIEAASSGDALTLRTPKLKFEAKLDSEELRQSVAADMQMWKDQVAQNIITNKIFSNLYKICKVKQNGDLHPLLHGLFVRGQTMLVPAHLIGFLNETDTIVIKNSFDVTFKLPWKDVRKEQIYDVRGLEKEAMLLSFPNYVNAHSDLVKHFSNGESMSMYRKANTCIPLLRYSDKFKKLMMFILGNHEAKACDTEIALNDSEKNYQCILRQGLEYRCQTIAGDCGAPVIINETQVLRKIAGIHVAGSADMNYAESITENDLLRTLQRVPVEFQIQVDFDQFCETTQSSDVPMNEEFGIERLTQCELPSEKFLPIGKIRESIFEPGKTDIRPSLVYGQIAEIKTKPAYLRHPKVNMKHVNLMKCALDTPYIRPELVDQAYEFVKPVWLSGKRKELARVLTWEETVVGSSESEYIGPINRQSSPGYPWILSRKSGCKGKTGWFGNDEYVLSEEVRMAVEKRIGNARLGIRTPTVWVDTLKDERRPIEKVDALKTRVFSNGPMDYNLAFRQYFLGFIAHLMENRITNEVSIGTNVYSQDWAKTARKLREKGRKVIAGDFSTFDGTLNSCIMARFVDMANEFYDDGPENALIRTVLFKEIYNSAHLCNGSVYMMNHSQPSGNPATTPLNCFINSMCLRIVFLLCANNAGVRYSMRDFNRHVSLVSYGDDNVINFSDEVAPWFNMDTITSAFYEIGFIYTDETKSAAGTAPLWRTLEEVAYLKRQFRFDEQKKVWEAPLSMDTILEMPNWCRGGLDIEEGTKVNCENAIMELSMHPKPTFDEWKRVISKAFFNATGEVLCTDTYEGYFQQRYMDYYV